MLLLPACRIMLTTSVCCTGLRVMAKFRVAFASNLINFQPSKTVGVVFALICWINSFLLSCSLTTDQFMFGISAKSRIHLVTIAIRKGTLLETAPILANIVVIRISIMGIFANAPKCKDLLSIRRTT